MTDKVVHLGLVTKLPLPVETVLTSDRARQLTEAVVIGWNPDGSLHVAMSDPNAARALMLLVCAQRQLIDTAEHKP